MSEQTAAAAETSELAKGEPVLACPYVGLVPYTEREADYFFGRERDIGLIVDNLRASRLTILFGPTGVGKTSVLRAGVVHRLREENRDSMERFGIREAEVAYCNSWREDPLLELGVAVRDVLSDVVCDPASLLAPDGAFDADSVARGCARAGVDLHLILDQFEECFIYHDESALDRLARQLARLMAPQVRVNLLIGIREDAMPRLDSFERYLPKLFQNFLRVDYLDAEAAREAVLGPLRRFNSQVAEDQRMDVEPELIAALIEQVRAGRVQVTDAVLDRPDRPELDDGATSCRVEAPFLQLVLIRLWDEERHCGSRTLRLATLSQLGGAQAIVRDHLDRVLRVFDDEEQRVAALLFRHLVTPSGTKIALMAEDLADLVGQDVDTVTGLLRRLCDSRARVLREIPPPMDTGASSRFEVFHDVLALAVADWRQRYVAEEERIASERQLRMEKESAERTAQQTRARLRRARAMVGSLTILSIACLVLALIAWTNTRRAEQAERESLIARSQLERPSDPVQALQDALRVWGMGHNVDAEQSLRAAADSVLSQHTLRLSDRDVNVTSARFSPDGRRVLTAADDGQLALWDADTGDLVRSARAEPSGNRPGHASFNRDGSLVVVGDATGGATVLDTSSGTVRLLPAGFPDVTGTTFVGSEAVLIYSPGGAPVQIWNARTGTRLSIVGDHKTVTAAADESGRYVVTWDTDATIRVWDWQRRAVVATQKTESDSRVYQLAFLAGDGNTIVGTDSNSRSLLAWEWTQQEAPRSEKIQDVSYVQIGNSANREVAVATDMNASVWRIGDNPSASSIGRRLTLIPKSEDWIRAVNLSPDGHWLATGGANGNVQVYLTNLSVEKRPVWELRGHQGSIWDVQFSSDGRRVVTAAGDGTARLWRLPAPRRMGHGYPVRSAAFSRDGHFIATAGPNTAGRGKIAIWNVETGNNEKSLDVANFQGGVSWSPDGTALATLNSTGGPPQVVNWRSNGAPVQFVSSEFVVDTVEWSPDPHQPLIAGGTRGDQVIGWDPRTGKIIWTTPLGPVAEGVDVVIVTFSADGSLLTAGTSDGHIALLNPADGHVRRMLQQPVHIQALALSRDGRYLASSGEDRLVRVWDLHLDGDRPQQELRGEGSTTADVGFDPTARFVVAAGDDATTQVWQRTTGTTVSVMRQHGDVVKAVVFSPIDPLLLVSGSEDGTAAVYRCELCRVSDADLARYAKQRLPRTSSLR